MTVAICPHCGQRMLLRYGTRLSPKLADIFDAIEIGVIDKKELCWMFYGNSNKKSMNNLTVNISHINTAFKWMESPIRIRSRGHNMPYRIEGRK